MSRPRSGNKRERLIASAVELFAEKGYFYTTTAEVSAHAGVAAGTLYLYFNSKDDVLLATLEAFLDDFTFAVVPNVYSATTPTGKIGAFVSGSLAFLEEHRSLSQVFFVELRQNNAALRNAAGGVWERYTKIARELLLDVRRGGGLDLVDIDDAVAMLLGGIELTAIRWLLSHDVRPPRSHAETLTAALLQGIGVHDTVAVS